MDIHGRAIYYEKIKVNGTFHKRFNISKYSKGIYIISFKGFKLNLTNKILVY